MTPRCEAHPSEIEDRVCYHLAWPVVGGLSAAEGGVVFCALGRAAEDWADWFEGWWEGEGAAAADCAIAVAGAGVGGGKVASPGCVDWIGRECYDCGVWGWVVGCIVGVCELFVGEESRGECLLEVGDSREGGYVWEVEVGEAHFVGVWFFLSICLCV